jgi:hypothetical protein
MDSYFFPQLTAAISGVPSLLFSFPTEEESSEVWRAALIHPSRYDLIKTKLQTHIDTFCSDIPETQKDVFRLVLHRLISFADSERRKKNLQTEYDFFLFETYRKFSNIDNLKQFMGMMLCSLLRETSALLDPRLVARQFTNHPAVKKMKTLVEDLIRKMHEASSQLQSEDQEELNFFVELEKVFDSETIKDDVLDSSIQRKILNHIKQVKDLKEKGFVSLSGEESPEDVDFVESVYSYFILSRILGYSIPQNGFEVKRKDVVTGGFILSREFFPNIMYVPANSSGRRFQDEPAFLLSHFITNKRPNPDSPIMKYFNAFLENRNGNVAAVFAQMIRQNKGDLGENVKVSKNHSRTRHVTGGAGVVDRTPESLSEQLNALRGPVAALIVQSSLLGLEVNAIFKAAYARLFGKHKSGKFSTHSLRQIFDEDIKPMDEIPEIAYRDDDLAEAQARDMMLTVRQASHAGGHPSSSLALVAQADDKLSELARLKKYLNILSYLDERAKNAQDSLFPFFTQRRISKIEEVIDVASIASMWSDIQNSFSSNKHFEKWLSEYSKDFRGIYTTWCVLLFSLRMPAIKNVVEALYGARTAHPEYASTKEGSSVFSALVMVMNAPNNQDTKLEFLRRAERLAQSLPDSDSKAVLLQALREVPGHNQQAVRIEGTTSLRQLAAPAPAVYPGQSMYQPQGYPARRQPLRLTDLAATPETQ